MNSDDIKSTTTFLSLTKTLDGSSKIPLDSKPFVVVRGGRQVDETRIKQVIQAVCASLRLPFLLDDEQTDDAKETWYEFYEAMNTVLRNSMYGLGLAQKLWIAGFFVIVTVLLLFAVVTLKDAFSIYFPLFLLWMTFTISSLWYHQYRVHTELERIVKFWQPALQNDLGCSVEFVKIKRNRDLLCLPTFESYLVIRQCTTTSVNDTQGGERDIV